jgi:phosphodiesterase/alkaline phosphatase D-like protein
VASGDPEPDRVLLWTRVTPAEPTSDVPVAWQVAADPDLREVAAAGEAVATAEHDFTVHVAASGLEPATSYWYRFSAGGVTSPVGRTRTAPDGSPARVRVGVVCCAHWAGGFFNAYGNLARRDVDVVLHLGDYLYEGRGRDRHTGVRLHQPPGRMVSLAEYRARHAQYKTDPDLRALHAAHPVVAVWDDHEIAGNCWRGGAPVHRPRVDGPFAERLAHAVRAYREWMPVPPAGDDPLRLYRTARFGDLCQLLMTDTRLAGRDRPAHGSLPVMGPRRRDRSLLGAAQWRWLEDELAARPAPRWRLLTSQVVVAPVRGGPLVNPGQWDGYPDERDRLLRLLGADPVRTVVVSGDLHSSWVSQLQAGGRTVAMELTSPAVSAPSFARKLAPPLPGGRRLLEWLIRRQNRHIRWVDTAGHGYLVLDVTAERIEAEWWHTAGVDRRGRAEHCAARLTIPATGGEFGLEAYSSSSRRAATNAS